MKERELVINYLVSYRRTEQSMLRYLFAFTCKLQFAILKLLRLQHEIPVLSRPRIKREPYRCDSAHYSKHEIRILFVLLMRTTDV